MLELTGGVKTKEWAVFDIPYLYQLFSQKGHELHPLQPKETPREEPKNKTS